jgi:CRISPR-associated protein Cas2
MPRTELVLSGYRGMWLMAMFDLPTVTKPEKRRYVQFRNMLLDEGFSMLQFSVYARYCASEEIAQRYRATIRKALPPAGSVRVFSITDIQFGRMENYVGKKDVEPEKRPKQLLLF